MAYNVFKRPMFKRGGSTQGTGIMSHVESKKIGGGAISGNNMPNNRTGFQAPILTIGEGMASEMARGKPGFSSTPFSQYASKIGPTRTGFQRALTSYPRALPLGVYGAGATAGMGIGALLDFYARGTKTPEEYRRLQEMSEFGIMDETNLDVGEALEYIKAGGEIGEAPGLFPRGGRRRFYEEKGLDPETGLPLQGERTFGGALSLDEIARRSQEQAEKNKLLTDTEVVKDEPAYEGTDIKSEVKRESKMIRELLKDEDYSKGELALIVAGSLAEPGGIAEKIKKAGELALPVARKRREEDKAITLAAYKLAKEKEQQQIKAGKLPETLRALKAASEVEAKRTGGDADKIYGDKLMDLAQSDAEKRAIATLQDPRIKASIAEQVTYIDDLNKKLQEAIRDKKNTDKLEKQLQEEVRKFDLSFRNDPYFDLVYPQYSKQTLGYAKGGRVKRAVGSDEDGETSDIISSQVSFTPETTTKDAITNETVVEKPVENLTFAELRDRLPPEITDDVVQMLASSEEALQDFAYIRTQNDVNNFNVKYGVNLVIPPTQE